MLSSRMAEHVGDSEFEWHVKTDRKADPAQIVKRHSATRNEIHDSSHATLASFSYLQRSVWNSPQANQGYNQSNKDLFIRGVKGYVKEDILRLWLPKSHKINDRGSIHDRLRTGMAC